MSEDYIRPFIDAFEKQFKHYKNWTFQYEYPGFLVYYHDKMPFAFYFTPNFNAANELAIQINYNEDVLDSDGAPFFSNDPKELFTIVKQWLDFVDENIKKSREGRGVLEWRPDEVPWKKRDK